VGVSNRDKVREEALNGGSYLSSEVTASTLPRTASISWTSIAFRAVSDL
jgi:hypothetical protein